MPGRSYRELPGADPNNGPALPGKEFQSLDVFGVPPGIGPMLLAVVLDSNLAFGPSHVDTAATDLDLSSGPR